MLIIDSLYSKNPRGLLFHKFHAMCYYVFVMYWPIKLKKSAILVKPIIIRCM